MDTGLDLHAPSRTGLLLATFPVETRTRLNLLLVIAGPLECADR